MAVTDRGADPGGEELHLAVFIGRAVVEIEPGRTAILGHGRFYHGHQVDEVVIKEDVDTGNKPAGVVDQGDHVDAVLFPVLRFQPGA